LGADDLFTASAWNLDHGLSYARKQRIARQLAAIDADVMHTKGTGFFDLMMWFPPIDNQAARVDASDLLAMLADPRAVMQPELALLGDAACHVLDVGRPDGSIAKRIWIDTERGGFPLRHEHFGADGNPVVIYESTSLAEIDGVWVPLQGFKWAPQQDGFPGDEVLIDVDVNDEGVPLVGLNGRIDPDVFEYHDQLPAGTVIVDASSKIVEVIGRGPLDGKPDATQSTTQPELSAEAMASPDRRLVQPAVTQMHSDPQDHSDAAPPVTDRRWLAFAIIALPGLVAAIVLAVLVRRRGGPASAGLP
jgi:hypothetical protein